MDMEYSELIGLINFTSDILFLFASFMSGYVVGFIIGKIESGDL